MFEMQGPVSHDLKLGPELPEMDPVRKYILLVLYNATADGATEVVFGEEPSDETSTVALRYKVSGQWYDFEPFPRAIRPTIVGIVCEMAGIPQDGIYPLEGVIDGPVDDIHLRWHVRITGDPDSVVLKRP
jgi:hypothetical protein